MPEVATRKPWYTEVNRYSTTHAERRPLRSLSRCRQSRPIPPAFLLRRRRSCRERRRLRRAMRSGLGVGAAMEDLVGEVVAGIAVAVSTEAAGEAAVELRRHKLVSAGLVRTTKGKRSVGSGRRRRRQQWRRVRAMEQQEQEQVQREVRERLDHVRWEEEQEQRWWRRAVSMWMQRRRAVVVDGRRYVARAKTPT